MIRVHSLLRIVPILVLLLCFHTALADTVLFVATDRHASYETVSDEHDDRPESDHSQPPKGKMPVYDPDGNLIWHNHLTEVLQRVAADGIRPDVFLLGGDHVGGGGAGAIDATGYPFGAPFFSVRSVEAQVRYVFGDPIQCLFTYGSHDNHCTDPYDAAFFSGPVTQEGYYIYGITFAQMIYAADKEVVRKGYDGKDVADPNGISAQTASRHFLSWVRSLDDHLPIIIMSHVPLHAARGDNAGAWTWTQALNTAAQDHDILFLWGHNHSVEKDEERKAAEQSHYLKLPGERLTVQSCYENETGESVLKSGKDLITRRTSIRFTYMNAGYLLNGFGTVLTFSDADDRGHWGRLQVRRYSLDNAEPVSWTVSLRR